MCSKIFDFSPQPKSGKYAHAHLSLTKVNQSHSCITCQQHILSFYISVQHARGVQIAETCQYLSQYVGDEVFWEILCLFSHSLYQICDRATTAVLAIGKTEEKEDTEWYRRKRKQRAPCSGSLYLSLDMLCTSITIQS